MQTERKLPVQLVKVLDHLGNYVCSVRYDWATYLALYSDPTNLSILQRAASPFFSVMQLRLRDNVILSLARLFDSPTTIPHSNLTLYYTVEMIRPYADPIFINEVEERIRKMGPHIAAIKQERHTRIAHLDADTALLPRAWGDVSQENIEFLLNEVESLLNQIDIELRGQSTYHSVYAKMASNHVAQLTNHLQVALMTIEVQNTSD